jgi:citrate synthase
LIDYLIKIDQVNQYINIKGMETSAPPRGNAASDAVVHEGLEGVVAAATRLSRVDGAAGRLTIAGYAVGELAPRRSFEAVAYLLCNDRLPSAAEERAYARSLAAHSALEPLTLSLLGQAAHAAPIDALRLATASLSTRSVSPERLLGALPTIVATHARLAAGKAPLTPDPAHSRAESFLYLLRGEPPSPAEVRALDTYWNTVSDHGLNASTFTARVIASTGSDIGSAIEGALGALKGPLHGGAPGPALEALLRLRAQGGDLTQATRGWAEAELRAGRRLMGFGHRVYRVRDPRADVLQAAAAELLAGSDLLARAQEHEAAVLETLARLKPNRSIATNVEFYTALLLHGLGFSTELFTPVFALGRLAGWLAHYAEQRKSGRLIRPDARYVGAEGRVVG